MPKDTGDPWLECIAIEWWDSERLISTSVPWVDLKEAKEFAEGEHICCHSIGMILHQDQNHITLIRDTTGHECDQPIKIPVNSIKRIGRVTVTWEDEDDREELEGS